MRQALIAVLILVGPGWLAPAYGDVLQTADVGEVDQSTQGEESIFEEEDEGILEDDEGVVEDELRYNATDFSAFETDDLVEDDYGFYDNDFDREVDDADWDAWYEGDTALWMEDGDEEGFWNL